MSEIYHKLQHYFDTLASGFPKTEKGTEINVLKMIYTEKEAELFLNMSLKKETPREAASRLERDENVLAEELEAMARKGLLFRKRENGKAFYSTSPFVVGILEYQITRLAKEPDLARTVAGYGMGGMLKSLADAGIPHMRTIPIKRNLVSQWPIATYDDAVASINSHQKIAVTDCTCRTIFKSIGMKSCNNPINNCIGFDEFAEYYIENQFGRKISKDEAIAIITKSDEHGMVLQPFNGKNHGALCSCCGDCCTMLISLKMRPHPAQDVKSSYFAGINPKACSGCGVCISRCQVQAINMNEDAIAVIDLNRCIGCGLCVTTCPADAAILTKKPESELYEPPVDLDQAHVIMAKNRGFTSV